MRVEYEDESVLVFIYLRMHLCNYSAAMARAHCCYFSERSFTMHRPIYEPHGRSYALFLVIGSKQNTWTNVIIRAQLHEECRRSGLIPRATGFSLIC